MSEDYKKTSYALIAITRHGCKTALEIYQKIHSEVFPVDIFFPEKFKSDFEENTFDHVVVRFYSGKVKDLLELIFKSYEGIIGIISLGALIRLMSPLLGDKKTDPAVVVIDEKAEYVISVLSGHIGGGNELARVIAKNIGARPVITTSSDVQKTLSVDLLGKAFNWVMESFEHLTEISAAVVNDEPVAIVQESGEPGWWIYEGSLPANLKVYTELNKALETNIEYIILISHRELEDTVEYKKLKKKKFIIFRPKVIGIGIGCNRNTTEAEIENVVFETLRELKFNIKSVRGLASIDLKSNEAGLISFCNNMKWPIVFYNARELNTVTIENRSDTVFKHTGAYGVSEPAAKMYTKNENLVLVKKISGNVTISVGVLRF
ncbi:MAG: cobalamin biosynthesis protein [Spirochaetia bacterium]|nr:cobalamin biosynthesis protein [Spirochaetia bacterium]